MNLLLFKLTLTLFICFCFLLGIDKLAYKNQGRNSPTGLYMLAAANIILLAISALTTILAVIWNGEIEWLIQQAQALLS